MKVIVVGGGLVGALSAVLMANRGHEVHMFEGRSDSRNEERVARQSINLALSTRGRAALRQVMLEEKVVKEGIAMYSRAIHPVHGPEYDIPYGTADQAILAIDRRRLNEILLTAAEECPNVKIYFRHKLVSADVAAGVCKFSCDDETVTVEGDLVIGADGVHSALRRDIMRRTRMDYQQTYIESAYKELHIPPSEAGAFQMREDYLHIWPRHSFMMIALPNPDKSFTVTIFMPWKDFDALKTQDQLLAFFEKYFPDSIALIGRERLVEDFFHNPTSPLIIIKCTPYHTGRCVILGDAAHAMVPFYGQGMNSGFEDVTVLDACLVANNNDVALALNAYTNTRHADAVAICDLALANYEEMRHKVTSRWFIFRKHVDNWLHWLLPSKFIPLYTMVTFSQIPYAQVIARAKRQDAIVNMALALGATGVSGLLAYVVLKHWRTLSSWSARVGLRGW